MNEFGLVTFVDTWMEDNPNFFIYTLREDNLDEKKKLTKEDINKAYLKIQKRIHPDVSPETSRLSSIVNEARDVLLNEIK